MKCVYWSLHDIKAGSFGNPQPFQNRDCALRTFSHLVSQPGILQYSFNDFEMVPVFIFDSVIGSVEFIKDSDSDSLNSISGYEAYRFHLRLSEKMNISKKIEDNVNGGSNVV